MRHCGRIETLTCFVLLVGLRIHKDTERGNNDTIKVGNKTVKIDGKTCKDM